MLTRREKLRAARSNLIWAAVCLVVLIVAPILFGVPWWYELVIGLCLGGFLVLAAGRVRQAEQSRKIDQWWERFGSAE